MIGKTISHYRIIERVGQGGMGVVYKAEDTKLNRAVALKFLPLDLTRNPEAKSRFIHEAQAASALDHPNICTIHEIDETKPAPGEPGDGQLFICMAFYDGKTLKEKIESGPLKLEEALDIISQITQGLAKAHDQEIVHRDIKPANVMMTGDGVVKIVDFGLAKLTGQSRLTRTGSTMGTVAYMSPEQARGQEVDHRTDIWSLGVVFYEMLTGELPFKGDYEQAVLYSIMNEDPEPITVLRPDIPAGLEQIVSKTLAKNPDERYQRMEDLLMDLHRIEEGASIKINRRHSDTGKHPQRIWGLSPILVSFFSVLIAVAILLVLLVPSKAIPFRERDWILITDFENQTGEDIFDKSLNTALSVSIGQSRYVNIFPRRRIEGTLRRMKKEKVTRVGEKNGQEIAVREGIKIMVLPSIARVGNQYVLTGVIQNPATGEMLRSEIVQSKDKDKVLKAMDELSNKIRRDLGESLEAISKQNKPLVKVTTSSLEALKQYSLAIENHWKVNLKEARLYYENALKIDTNFTTARASLGMLLYEKFDRKRGKQLLEKAVRETSNLTDREKYGILAFHANAVENNLDKAIEYMKMLLALYPDYSSARNNLGWYYHQLGRYGEAIVEYKKALRLNPYAMFTYNGLNWIYLNQLGEIDSAIVWSNKQISRNPQNPWGYDYLGWAYLGKDSLKRAESAFKKALEVNPNFVLDLYRLAHAYRLQGRYQEAIQPLKKILEIKSTESSAYYDLGVNYQLMGDEKSARQHFERFRKDAEQWVREDPKNGENYISLGLVLARLGEKEQSWTMAAKADEIESTSHFGYAQLLTVLGKKQEAIDHLKLQVEQGYRNYIWMKIHPDFQPIYNEERFKRLIKKGLKG